MADYRYSDEINPWSLRARLVWAYLPTLEQVRQAESQIMGGGVRFAEVFKAFSLHIE